jgi:YHS domain-containing protein
VANSTYGLVIAPIFESKCNGCHSQSRHKGGLSLEEPGAISKGGKNGPVIVPGEPEASEMVRRLRLPLDDDDHMPPPSKAQPAPEEVGAIAAWIAAGARFEGMDADRSAPARPTETVAANDAGATQARKAEAVPPADPAAIGALRDRLVHVEPVQRGSNLLVVDFSAIAGQLSAPQILSLLEPVREQVADLSIARSPAGDDVLKLAARMPNLKRLNATATPITDAGVAELAHHQHLEELVLTQDHLTDSAAEYLLTMPALKRVYVWKSGISAASLDGARERSVIVDAGEFQASQADESETEVKLTGDAPVPGKTVPAGVDALKPVNTVCPVSGKAVDPNFAVVYKGRVIGFCCAVCASQFLADPAKFEDKVH